jgi:hypothetical protein
MAWPWLVPLTYILSALATALAWVVARRNVEHRSCAALLTFGLASDVVRRLLQVHAIGPGYARAAGAPLTGVSRVAFHVSEALFFAWLAGLVAVALRLFMFPRRPLWPVAAAWGTIVVALILTYPTTRGAVLQRVYLGGQAVTMAVTWGFVLAWIRWPERGVPTFAQTCLAIVLMTELMQLFVGPWTENVFTAWPAAQLLYAVMFGFLMLLQGGISWIGK